MEPASTPEGVLAKRALQEYKALRQNLDDVRSLPPSLDYKKIDFEMMKKRKNKKIKWVAFVLIDEIYKINYGRNLFYFYDTDVDRQERLLKFYGY